MDTGLYFCASCLSFACILQCLKCTFGIWGHGYPKHWSLTFCGLSGHLKQVGCDDVPIHRLFLWQDETRWWFHSVDREVMTLSARDIASPFLWLLVEENNANSHLRHWRSCRSAWTYPARILVLVFPLNSQSTKPTFVSHFSSDHSWLSPSFSFCWKHRPAMAPNMSMGISCHWAYLAGEKVLCVRCW